MTVPVLEKNWQHVVNVACGGQSTDERDAADYCINVKDALVGFPSGQWSVVASSDGTTADLTDRWTDPTTLLWNTDGSPHAWIVLANSATGMEICFDFNTTTAGTAELLVSPSDGFDVSSPVTTNRPTTTDTISYTTTDAFAHLNGTWSGYAHIMMSTDGECTRFMQCISGLLCGLVILDTVKDPLTEWTSDQLVCFSYGASGGIDMYVRAYDVDSFTKLRFNGSYFRAYLTSGGYDNQALGEVLTVVDGLTGEWLVSPVGIASEYGSRQGRKGALYDLWFGPKSINNSGDCFPADGSKQFVQFGFMIFPWNGTTPNGGGTDRPIGIAPMTGGAPDRIRTFYKMAGWNTVLLQTETWISATVPSTTPPVGPCVNVKIAARWNT